MNYRKYKRKFQIPEIRRCKAVFRFLQNDPSVKDRKHALVDLRLARKNFDLECKKKWIILEDGACLTQKQARFLGVA